MHTAIWGYSNVEQGYSSGWSIWKRSSLERGVAKSRKILSMTFYGQYQFYTLVLWRCDLLGHCPTPLPWYTVHLHSSALTATLWDSSIVLASINFTPWYCDSVIYWDTANISTLTPIVNHSFYYYCNDNFISALYFGLLSVAVIDVFGISRIQTGACAQQVTGGLAVMFMLPISGTNEIHLVFVKFQTEASVVPAELKEIQCRQNVAIYFPIEDPNTILRTLVFTLLAPFCLAIFFGLSVHRFQSQGGWAIVCTSMLHSVGNNDFTDTLRRTPLICGEFLQKPIYFMVISCNHEWWSIYFMVLFCNHEWLFHGYIL